MSATEFIEQGEDPGIDPALRITGGRVENGAGDRGPTAVPPPVAGALDVAPPRSLDGVTDEVGAGVLERLR